MPDIPTEAARRIAEYEADGERLTDAERESIILGCCGPLLYGGPCWLLPGHKPDHHCYREDVDAVAAAHLPQHVSPSVEGLARAIHGDCGICPGGWVADRRAAERVLALLPGPTVEQVRAEALAQGWDEGARAGFGAGPIITLGQLLDANPHRARAAEAGEPFPC